MHNHKRLIMIATFAIVAVFATIHFIGSPKAKIDIAITTYNGDVHVFNVEVAANVNAQRKGLMRRKSMSDDSGMLFVYKSPRNDIAFWMKNTLIPLDMLFISGDGKILKIHENAIPHDETPIYAGVGVKSVLEINGGLSKKFGIAAGDYVTLHSSGDTSD